MKRACIVFVGAAFVACGDPAAPPGAAEATRGEGIPAASSTPPSSPGVPAPGPSGAPSAGPPTSDAGGDAPIDPPDRVRGLVGVGYGGLRILSRDGGRTWPVRTAATRGGGDDFDLLRAVAYANGTWLAVGWSVTTSRDGVTWTPLARINQPGGVAWTGAPSCGLVEGLTSDGAAFYAACADFGQPHKAYRSTDGVAWTAMGTIGQVGGHPALAYRDGVFVAYGDPGTSFRSQDAVTWTVMPGLVQATFCEGQWRSKSACRDASWFGGAYFQSVWQSKVTRADGAGPFVVVHDDTSNNTLYQPRAIAEGLVAR